MKPKTKKPKTKKPKTKKTSMAGRRVNPSATPKSRKKAAEIWGNIPKTEREEMVTGLLQECGIPRRRLVQLLPDPSAEEIAEAAAIRERSRKARDEYERNPAVKAEREEQLRKAKDALRKARSVAPDDPRTKLLDFFVRSLAAEVRAMRPRRCTVPCPPDGDVKPRPRPVRAKSLPAPSESGGAIVAVRSTKQEPRRGRKASPIKVPTTPPTRTQRQIGAESSPPAKRGRLIAFPASQKAAGESGKDDEIVVRPLPGRTIDPKKPWIHIYQPAKGLGSRILVVEEDLKRKRITIRPVDGASDDAFAEATLTLLQRGRFRHSRARREWTAPFDLSSRHLAHEVATTNLWLISADLGFVDGLPLAEIDRHPSLMDESASTTAKPEKFAFPYRHGNTASAVVEEASTFRDLVGMQKDLTREWLDAQTDPYDQSPHYTILDRPSPTKPWQEVQIALDYEKGTDGPLTGPTGGTAEWIQDARHIRAAFRERWARWPWSLGAAKILYARPFGPNARLMHHWHLQLSNPMYREATRHLTAMVKRLSKEALESGASETASFALPEIWKIVDAIVRNSTRFLQTDRRKVFAFLWNEWITAGLIAPQNPLLRDLEPRRWQSWNVWKEAEKKEERAWVHWPTNVTPTATQYLIHLLRYVDGYSMGRSNVQTPERWHRHWPLPLVNNELFESVGLDPIRVIDLAGTPTPAGSVIDFDAGEANWKHRNVHQFAQFQRQEWNNKYGERFGRK